MKRSIIIIIIFVIIVLLVGTGCVLFILDKQKTKDISQMFYNQVIVNHKNDPLALQTGVYYDLSKTTFDYKGEKPSEGIIFLDEDGSVQVFSNIKIKGKYCVFRSDHFDCSIKYKKDSNISKKANYKEYSVGDAVTLLDGTKWHVINDSSHYSKYVTLIKDERVDVDGNNDVLLIPGDEIAFDVDKKKKYDVTKEGNIGYYIENTYRKSLTSLQDILTIRILTEDELVAIQHTNGVGSLSEEQIRAWLETKDEIYDSIGWMTEYPRPVDKLKNVQITEEQYQKLMPHWLYNESSGNWWLMPVNNKTITVVWSGEGCIYSSAKTGYYLKPVMTLAKSNVLEG